MRNNLLTLPRDVKAMPYVTLNGNGIGQSASFTWPNSSTVTLGINIKLENVSNELKEENNALKIEQAPLKKRNIDISAEITRLRAELAIKEELREKV